jgi:hypothetical protein
MVTDGRSPPLKKPSCVPERAPKLSRRVTHSRFARGRRPKSALRARQDKAKGRMKNTLFFFTFAFYLFTFAFTINALQRWDKTRSFPVSDFPQRAPVHSVS